MVDLLLDLILAKRVPDVGGPLLLRLLLADIVKLLLALLQRLLLSQEEGVPSVCQFARLICGVIVQLRGFLLDLLYRFPLLGDGAQGRVDGVTLRAAAEFGLRAEKARLDAAESSRTLGYSRLLA